MTWCAGREDSWQVRVSDAAGNTVGAGVLLGRSQVLTCAHVVRDAGVTVTPADAGPGGLRAESVLCPKPWAITARVIPDCWVSPRGTQRGDVALLALDSPVPCHEGARLGEVPDRGAEVRVRGFPDGGRIGNLAEGRLVGSSYGGEWVEIHPAGRDRGPWVARGFSGAGVVSQQTGDVVGILVAVQEERSPVDGRIVAGNAWMMPVEAIRRYLPALARRDGGGQAGSPAVLPADPGGEPAALEPAALEPALRREVGRLLSPVWSGAAVVTGRAGGGATWLTRLLASPGPPGPEADGRRAADLVIDATGRTLGDVCGRLAERFGLPADAGRRALVDGLLHHPLRPVIVIDQVDSSAEPARLAGELLGPLAERARRYGVRLLLGFAGQPPGNLLCEVWLGTEPLTGQAGAPASPAAVHRLLARLAEAEEELWLQYADIGPRLAGVTGPPACLAPRLRVRYAVAAAARSAELSLVAEHAEAALAAVLRADEGLQQLRRRHEELGADLEAYRRLAEGSFGAEDPQLGEIYSAALEKVRAVPCDLAASRRAVHGYVTAVRRRLTPGAQEAGP